MDLKLYKLSVEKWNLMAKDAYEASFQEKHPEECAPIDFVLLVINEEKQVPMGYVTIKEATKDTIYWQHGGAFPEAKQTTAVLKMYNMFLDWCGKRYKRVYTMIENTNNPMLKIALNAGYQIIGMKNYGGKIMLELILEFQKEGDCAC